MTEAAGPLRRALLPTAVFAGVLLLMEAAVRSGTVPPSIAAPSRIAASLADQHALLWYHLEPTLLTASTGLLLALGLALGMALLVYLVKPLEPTLLTIGTVVDSVPMIAIAPVLVIWLGLSLPMRITITTVICLFPIFVSTVQGLKAAPDNVEQLFTTLAASRMQRFRLLAIPYALPYLFVGLKVSAPLAVLGALIAEWTGVERGLGVYLLNAMFALKAVPLWTGVTVACAISAGAYLLVCLFEALSLGDGARAETMP
jgi:NitT/TauT family transport system permease protein